MKTNSKVKNQEPKQTKKSGAATDTSNIQKATELQTEVPNPDYSSMEKEIKKIENPVSFDALKAFYGME